MSVPLDSSQLEDEFDGNTLVHIDVLQIFRIYPIFNTICEYLNPRELIALQRTTKQLSGVFDMVYKSQWNANRLLERYVVNPKALRCLMARHNALIGGSVAFQFFDRTTWKDNVDLDIYVQARKKEINGTDSATLKDFLIGEGYEAKNKEDEPLNIFHPSVNKPLDYNGAPPIKHNISIMTYDRHIDKGGFSRVHLIYTPDIPVMTILNASESTALLNFVSWDAGYSLFPDMTFLDRKTRALGYVPYLEEFPTEETLKSHGIERLIDPRLVSVFSKYRSINQVLPRRIEDSKTWKIDLDCTDIEEGTPASVFRYSFFKVDRLRNVLDEYPDLFTEKAMREFKYSLTSVTLSISPKSFKSCALRHTYTNAEWAFWNSAMIHSRVSEYTRSQYLELEEEQRPAYFNPEHEWEFEDYADRIRQNPPTGWKFWDNELPRWYDDWIDSEVRTSKKETERQIEGTRERIEKLRAELVEEESWVVEAESGLDASLVVLRDKLASI